MKPIKEDKKAIESEFKKTFIAIKGGGGQKPSKLLPRDISVYRKGDVYYLKLCNPPIKNMQCDDMAFEGWATLMRAHMGAANTILNWVPPKNPNNPHYQRFLYRVKKFSELYSWFSYEKQMSRELDKLKLNGIGPYVMSAPQEDRIASANNPKKVSTSTASENVIERAFLKRTSQLAVAAQGLTKLSYQLPVGVFEGAKPSQTGRIFTGGKSAIDLWGVNAKHTTFYLFELKIRQKKIGAISEMFFYSMVVSDMQCGFLKMVKSDKRTLKSDIPFEMIPRTKRIEAYLLCDVFHPLVWSLKVLNVLNDFSSERDIAFDLIHYSQDFACTAASDLLNGDIH